MRYASIRKMDISNGEGVGISLFVQGCPYHCQGCFNPETWDFEGGKEWTPQVEQQFLNLASRPQITRISFLGGEPLCPENAPEINKIIYKIKNKYGDSKKIWIYTGGVWEQYRVGSHTEAVLDTCQSWIEQEGAKMAIRNADILVDGPYIHELRDITLPFRGSSNQRIIDVQASLKKGEIVLWTPKH